jgi:hypothetical protein
LSSIAFSESTRRIETIFQAQEAATITRLWYYCSTVSGTAPTLRISLQGVDATTGTSDGTIKGATNNCLATFTPSVNVGAWATLGESYTCTRGELLAIVTEYSSGTIDTSHLASLIYSTASVGNSGFPYAVTTNTGVRNRVFSWPIWGYGSASKAYGVPISVATQQSFNSGSSPNEYGLRFVVPTGWCSTFKLIGAWIDYSNNPAGATQTLTLYDSDGTTVLQQFAVDTDIGASSATSSARSSEVYFDEAALSTLNAGTAYRLAVSPSSATGMSLPYFQVLSNDDLEALPMGKEWYLTKRTGAGAWTDDSTSRPWIVPIFSDMTGGAGGGAFSPSPGRVLYVPPSGLILE